MTVGAAREVLAGLVAELCADDEIDSFRAVLEDELGRAGTPAAVWGGGGGRELSVGSVGSVDEVLAACADAQERTNCFVEISTDGVWSAGGSGVLAGVPYAFKDMFTRGGRRPGLGVRGALVRTRADESTCLDRLDAAGAVPVGRLNLDPYGYAATGLNDVHGDVRNPWNPEHIAGGSSSGAAAAVAAGALPLAVGSDTAGSVRIPAALCGVVGLKPTYGRVPRTGCVPLSYSQDTIGIIAGTVADAALALSVMSGHDPGDPSSFRAPAFSPSSPPDGARPLDGVRVGVDEEYLRGLCDPEVLDAVLRARSVLGELGARTVPVRLDELHGYDVAASVLTWCEAGAVHERALAGAPGAYPGSVRTRLHQALAAHGTDHVNALRLRGAALRGFLSGVLAGCDVIATAAAPVPAPRRDAARADPLATTARLLSANRPFSFLGLPAITVPAGRSRRNLPLGLQLVARPWAEATLLRVAAAYETSSKEDQ
ncbi:amidase [Pseudonocardia acaciae]|uniref:amidase n=1 Tax=Pseudonocardia acaciae TaxID=551276 RepID=UPI0006884564|nr:amidase [Pseudonocardia acaciae]